MTGCLKQKIEKIPLTIIKVEDLRYYVDEFILASSQVDKELKICVVAKYEGCYFPITGFFSGKNGEKEFLVIESVYPHFFVLFSYAQILQPDIICKSFVLRKMLATGIKLEEAITLLSSFIGEKFSLNAAKELIALGELDNSLLEIIHEKKIGLKNAKEFLKFSNEEQKLIVHLYKNHNVSTSVLKILCGLLYGVKSKKKEKFGDILTDIYQLSNDEKFSISKIILFLKNVIYPEYCETEKKFWEIKSRLSFPARVKLKETPYFESEDFLLEIAFNSEDELKTYLKKITNSIDAGLISALFTLLD